MSPDAPAQIQYTSGTTGFPKGAVLHHRGIVNNARLYTARLGLGPGNVYLSAMPLFHTAGCVMSVLGAFVRGFPRRLVVHGSRHDVRAWGLSRVPPRFTAGQSRVSSQRTEGADAAWLASRVMRRTSLPIVTAGWATA